MEQKLNDEETVGEMNMCNKEFNFFCDWYFRAQLDENYDADRQFFYFYALFDHLFKSYADEKKGDLDLQGLQFKSSERSKMRYYLFNIFYTEQSKDVFGSFNPFATLKTCKQTKLIEKLKAKNIHITDENHNLPPFSELIALFEEIYTIRCNLFHGSADLSDFENNTLIDEANIVLKELLKRIFETDVFKKTAIL